MHNNNNNNIYILNSRRSRCGQVPHRHEGVQHPGLWLDLTAALLLEGEREWVCLQAHSSWFQHNYKSSTINSPENEDWVCVSMVVTDVQYGMEYLGNLPRLVVTPLTDRCYRWVLFYSPHAIYLAQIPRPHMLPVWISQNINWQTVANPPPRRCTASKSQRRTEPRPWPRLLGKYLFYFGAF